MSHLLNLAEFVSPAILAFAAIQSTLVIMLFATTSRMRKRLRDGLHNLARGTHQHPERDSLRRAHDDIAAHLDFLISTCADEKSTDMTIICRNAKNFTSRHIDRSSFWLETLVSVVSAGIQLFPLMGIFGTILALGQTTLLPGEFTATTVSKAFVIALDTTILGILFAIIFTLIEAVIVPSVSRTIEEAARYRDLLATLARGDR